jgi:hypothetical protein
LNPFLILFQNLLNKTNKMTKKTKYVLGAAILGVGAYLYFKSKKKSFANLTSKASPSTSPKPSYCVGTPTVVKDSSYSKTCHLACENRDGDAQIIQYNVPCGASLGFANLNAKGRLSKGDGYSDGYTDGYGNPAPKKTPSKQTRIPNSGYGYGPKR